MSDIIQGLWIGQSLSTMENLSIQSFIEHGHEYHLYTYNALSDVPPKAVIKDANEILPASMIFQYKEHKSYAGFSNYFRYKLLLEKGGWWSDLDIICLKPLSFDTDYVFASEVSEKGVEVVTSGILKAPKGAEVLCQAWATCRSKNPQELKWGETGPELLQELVLKLSLNEYVKDSTTFCPIHPLRFYEVILPNRWKTFSDQTHTVHLWNEFWRRFEIDKDEEYTPTSLYERLKHTYLRTPAERARGNS
jgi:mannosyltransferase OCH1-like enzyme